MTDSSTDQRTLDPQVQAAVAGRIRHVFVLMLENRSFDHVFALSGIPGIQAATAANTNAWQNEPIAFQAGAPEQMPSDPGHEFKDVVEHLCGAGVPYVPGKPYPPVNLSGFASNYGTTTTEGPTPPANQVFRIMQGLDTRSQSPALYQLATQFVLCDNWRASLPGPTWPNRYFVHGASSAGLDDSPSKEELALWETLDGFTYPKGSIFDALKLETCRLYQDRSGPVYGHIPQVASLKGINLTDVDDLGDFEKDIQGNYPYRYTFIEPSYGDIVANTYEGGSSQHPMDGIKAGDQLVARVYAAIRNSPVWDSSLLIVTYDEHGGFYDSVPPIPAPPPNDGADTRLSTNHFDYSLYGVRVPAIVVSPWVQQGGICHALFDHATVPATLERLFGLPPLNDRDKAANDVLFLVTATCRTDCPQRIA
jgi:phospholipase C